METIYHPLLPKFEMYLQAYSTSENTRRTTRYLVLRILDSDVDLGSTSALDDFIDAQKLSTRAPLKTAWRRFVDFTTTSGVFPPALPSPGVVGRPHRPVDRLDTLLLALHERGITCDVLPLIVWTDVRRADSDLLFRGPTGTIKVPFEIARELHKTFFPTHEVPPEGAPLVPNAAESIDARPEWSIRASVKRAFVAVRSKRIAPWTPPPPTFD